MVKINEVDKTKLTPEELAVFNAFETASNESIKLPTTVTQEEKLKLYVLFKQSLDGDNTRARPGMFQLEARHKHDAWLRSKGKSKVAAQKEYTEVVAELYKKYVKPTPTTTSDAPAA
ncbi:acyl-CoA-binding protein (ACBP)/diazepam binding inhibitor (DBI)/endozepine (EP) [Coemansia sp. RSA 2050]|nr:acyl-CoA-binding protein (ACBP)/diazepam binding inhibitor (DBI)/endozepine (EP) [Coemansia sp. RSA 2050]KAJ2729012.1 acyl-CoA-binding protein (ACBP)/diazepam binding inhibitor (DBI)/endozepine (EP) [Coemansia sp. BCRC 34962]